MADFFGTPGDDRIAGTSQADLIFGGDGANVIKSGAGDDVVYGGAGADNVEGGAGNDLVYGGGGNDVLGGGEGNDILIGGAGSDQLDGGVGDDILSGGDGADTFNFKAGWGNDVITDFTFGGADGDKLNIFAGAIDGVSKNVTIKTLADLDALVSSGAAERVDGTTDPTLAHGAVKFVFDGGNSITFLNFEAQGSGSPNSAGSSGNDLLYTGSLPGQITGGIGDDVALAGSGVSNINGGEGSDKLVGGAGDDLIGGGGGNDYLFGGAGHDTLNGGTGDDILTGDSGADIFQFAGAFGHDTVTDLSFAEGDSLAFNLGGDVVKITTEAQLLAFASAHGGVDDGHGNLDMSFDAGLNTVKLIGLGPLIV